jgi:hypothetical protein
LFKEVPVPDQREQDQKKEMTGTKIILSFCALFFLVVGIYLRVTHSSANGFYKSKGGTGRQNGGFRYTEMNGDFVLFLALLSFVALYFIFKPSKK